MLWLLYSALFVGAVCYEESTSKYMFRPTIDDHLPVVIGI